MTNEEKCWKIIKDMQVNGPWQEHLVHAAMMKLLESEAPKIAAIDYWAEEEIKRVYEMYENPDFLDYESFANFARYFIGWQKNRQNNMPRGYIRLQTILKNIND